MYVLVVLTIVCLVPATIHAQATANPKPMTNRDVLDLVTEGFSSEVIIAKITSSSCEFDTTVEALKNLKREKVPQEVILAMVQAHTSAISPKSSPKLSTIECSKGDTQAILWVAPGKMEEVSRLHCNDRVTISVERPPWVLVRTESGLTGYLPASYFNGENSADPLTVATRLEADRAAEQSSESKPRVSTPPSRPMAARVSSCSPAVESTITGEFQGWEGETIFKLDNGQIWQQAEYDYTYDYEYRPDVTIYQTAGGCKMKVEGVEETVLVRRIK